MLAYLDNFPAARQENKYFRTQKLTLDSHLDFAAAPTWNVCIQPTINSLNVYSYYFNMRVGWGDTV